ncbi:MAG: PEP-CTERM sorting domain-containing protein [Desulfuromusa sp.]|jgi:hypothetical protein|nr:PEP-CTERM sorting domain-containing protein [Desulfuromusa sp.]
MGGRISGVKAAATEIFNGLDAFGDVAASVGVYSEAARLDPAGTVPGRVINQDLTTDSATAISAISAVTLNNPDGGGDGPENGVNGIELSTENLSWRTGSNRFLFVFGDYGFKTSESTEASYAAGLFLDATDNVDGAPISTAANAIDALTDNSVELFGLGASGSFANAIATLGGDFVLSGTDPDSIVSDIIAGVTSSFAEYNTVTLDDLGAGLPGVGVSVVATGAGAVGDSYVGDYDRSDVREFAFDVTFTGMAEGVYDFDTLALVDGGVVAREADSFTVGEGTEPVPEPSTIILLGAGLVGLAAIRRKKK